VYLYTFFDFIFFSHNFSELYLSNHCIKDFLII
jgi:hypothetical protein